MLTRAYHIRVIGTTCLFSGLWLPPSAPRTLVQRSVMELPANEAYRGPDDTADVCVRTLLVRALDLRWR